MRAAVVMPDWAARVVPPPYDSLHGDAREAHLAEMPDSFLHVARSAGMGHGHPTEHRRLAAEGDAALQRLLSAGAYSPREDPRLYVQRIDADDGTQVAVLGAIRDGERKLVPHEQVHPGRVRALAAHFQAVGAMSSPVVVTSRDIHSDRSLIDEAQHHSPMRDLHTTDGARIRLWAVDEPSCDVGGDLFIIDGHHRVAAAEQAHFDQLFVAYVPPESLVADSFDRAIDELAVMPRRLIELLSPWCDIEEADVLPAARELDSGTLAIRLGEQVVLARRRRNDGLDADFVHSVVLPELFDIVDPSDIRLTYRPSCSTDLGDAVLIRTAPVPLAVVLDTASAGETMPPKSTYFVPKARSGLMLVPC